MDVIPFMRYAFGIFIGGLLFYAFNAVLRDVLENAWFAEAMVTNWYALLMIMWVGIPLLFLIVGGVQLIMSMQKRRFG